MPQTARIPRGMAKAIEKYNDDATKILNGFVNTVEGEKPPSVLYHYTNDAGLTGIIESGQLWFSDIFSLNDPSELKHGLRIAIDLLKSRSVIERPEIDKFASMFEQFINTSIEVVAHFFICCFSADGDHLGQWRAYADNGQGFALGFDTSLLEGAFAKNQHSTFSITYNDDKLTDIQTSLVELVVPLISLPRKTQMCGDSLDAYMKDLLVYHSLNVIQGAIFFKHTAYKEEKEYRFLQLFRGDKPAPDVNDRQRGTLRVRYRVFDWRTPAPGVLKKIVLGPAADKIKTARFAKDCLAAFHANPDGVKLVCSKIPYRVTELPS